MSGKLVMEIGRKIEEKIKGRIMETENNEIGHRTFSPQNVPSNPGLTIHKLLTSKKLL
jgi:hypothetical protein